MAQIPDYQEKRKIELSPIDHIPKGIGEGGPEEAMQKAGAALASMGNQWGRAIQDAQDVTALSSVQAQASQKLNELRNEYLSSEDFNKDPQGTMAAYQKAAAQMSQDLLAGMPSTSMKAKAMARAHIDGMTAHYNIQAADDVRKKQIDILKGVTLQNIQTFANGIADAPNDQVVHDNIKAMYTGIDGAIASGAISYEDGVRLKEVGLKQGLMARAHNGLLANPLAVMAQVQNGQGIYKDLGADAKASLLSTADAKSVQLMKEQRQEAKYQEDLRVIRDNTAASDQLTLKYGLDKPTGNFDAALQDASNPQTAAGMGLKTQKQRDELQQWVHAQRGRMEQGVKAEQTKLNNDLLDGALSGKYTPAQILSSNADPQKKKEGLEIISKRKTDADKTDPVVWKQVMDLVDAKKITAWNQISPFILHGLSTTDGYRFKELVEKGDDMDTSGYTKLAHETFQNRYVDKQGDLTADAVAAYPGFCMELDAAIKRDSLRGSAIMKRAKEIMDGLDDVVTDGFLWKSKTKPTANWERLKNWGQLDTVSPGPAQSVPPTNPQIPAASGSTPTDSTGEQTPVQQQAAEQSDFRNWISEQLRQAKLPVTDANVEYLAGKWKKHDKDIEKTFRSYKATKKGAQQ